MPRFQPRDPGYAERVADVFWDETAAARWAGELTSVLPGVVEIEVSVLDASTGGPGILHRSIVAAFLDDACQLAALESRLSRRYGKHRRVQAELSVAGVARRAGFFAPRWCARAGASPSAAPTPWPATGWLPRCWRHWRCRAHNSVDTAGLLNSNIIWWATLPLESRGDCDDRTAGLV